MATAAIYTRLSLAREDQTSTERQERDCRMLCESRGAEVVGVYSDLLSGWNRKVRRPDYERFLDDIAAHAFDLAVIWKLDRLTRQGVREVARLLDALEAGGVRLVSVQDSIDTSTAMGEGILGLLASIAKQESENISARVRSAKDHAARNGTPSGGGTRPFGYDVDRVSLVPTEAALIQEAARRILDGESFWSVCKDWEDRDVRTPTGRHWQENQLRQMLRSPRLAGLRVHRGEVVGSASWPAVLDAATARRVAAAAAFSGRRGRSPRAYLLTGMVFCGRCQGALKPQRRQPTNARSYVCIRQPGFANCGSLRIQADPIEALVELQFIAKLDAGEFLDVRDTDAPDELAAAVAEAEDEMVQLSADYGSRLINRAEWLARRAPIEARLNAARRRMQAEARYPVLSELATEGAMVDQWMAAPLVRRRSWVEATVDRIDVAPAAQRGPHFDPGRVAITWR